MPPRGNTGRKPPPPVMTWGKAAPFLVLAAIFDALRFMCEWLIFFGPAFAAFLCTVSANSFLHTTITSVAGKVVAAVCIGTAATAGAFGSEFTGPLGMIMAMAVGLIGWMTIITLLSIFNARIFKEDAWNMAWMIGSLAIAEVPFIGSVPSISLALWRLYHVQIKKDKAALATYKKEQAAQDAQERQAQERQMQTEEEVSRDEEEDEASVDEKLAAYNAPVY